MPHPLNPCTLLQHGLELLVSQTADDKLDLSDAFLLDSGTELYSRVEVVRGVPKGAAQYLAMPWEIEYPGDVSKFKDTEYKVSSKGWGGG